MQAAWELHRRPTDLGDVAKNLTGVMQSLNSWSARTIGSIPRKIEKTRKKIGQALANPSHASQQEATALSKQMDGLLDSEEIYWRQRSRIGWIREGDRNTKFFHHKATWRAKKNNINQLVKPDGTLTADVQLMEQMTTAFFQNLYSADNNVNPSFAAPVFTPKITDQMNLDLCREFSDEEISDALFQIGPWKAPGPDGMPARFFQRQWTLLKEDICRAVREFFRTGSMPEGVNDTTIELIPKIKDPTNLKDFRPIGLCNVIYKIISKCLTKQIQTTLAGHHLSVAECFYSWKSDH